MGKKGSIEVVPPSGLFKWWSQFPTLIGQPPYTSEQDPEDFRKKWQDREEQSLDSLQILAHSLLAGTAAVPKAWSSGADGAELFAQFEKGFAAWIKEPRVATVFTNRVMVPESPRKPFVVSSVSEKGPLDLITLSVGQLGAEQRLFAGWYFGLSLNTSHRLATSELKITLADWRDVTTTFIQIGRLLDDPRTHNGLTTDELNNFLSTVIFGFRHNDELSYLGKGV